MTDYPFGSECDKAWWHYDQETLEYWINDRTLTLECKDKGNSKPIISSILIKLVK